MSLELFNRAVAAGYESVLEDAGMLPRLRARMVVVPEVKVFHGVHLVVVEAALDEMTNLRLGEGEVFMETSLYR